MLTTLILIIAGIYAIGFAVLRAAKPAQFDVQAELERERAGWEGTEL